LSAVTTTRKRMGLITIVSSLFIAASIVLSMFTYVMMINQPRQYEPHQYYPDISKWPYDINWAGGTSDWFINMNYTDFQINQPLPQDILDHLNDVVFLVTPKDPGQLWRQESYDYYDGAGWSKTETSSFRPLTSEELISPTAVTNTKYTVFLNVTGGGATVGSVELPTLFPYIRVINGSFRTYTMVSGLPEADNPSRIIYLNLKTDPYGTLLLETNLRAEVGERVLTSFDITFVNQDLNNVATHALQGSAAPGWTAVYTQLPALTQTVVDNITQFESVGSNAYEKAMAVKTYFQSTFQFNTSLDILSEFPQGQEVTDWFLERGNGLPQHFATAYAVFMRYLGIPARVVCGYALGAPVSGQDIRKVMVSHMTFWVEVYIPMSTSTGGEWIQVNPVPLPRTPEMGGDENPPNTPVPDIQLSVWPANGRYWADIGTPFELSAKITVDGVPVTTPDTITFNDLTDSQLIGTATIGQSPDLPIANITYSFPASATPGYHILSASWDSQYFSVVNATSIYAVGVISPIRVGAQQHSGFIISETQELNVSQGLDNYIAYWEDTVHVFGTMKVNGQPFNSSEYNNRYIQIMWDNTFVGNASIDEYGYYELSVYVDPMNYLLTKVGPHEVWSWYLGDMDGPILRVHETRSSNNSTVTVWGRIGFGLSVTPTNTAPGGTVTYDGSISLLNGTLIPAGQNIGVFFGAHADSTTVNATGGFHFDYMIPVSQPDGTYFARVNWTNSLNWPYIVGNWSISIPIEVGAGGTKLWVNQLPDPLFIGQRITIWGYLTHVANGSGIGGRSVDIWWSTGALINLGPAITAADGYFEINYTIPAGYEGSVEYWANFTSTEPKLASSELSPHLFTHIKRYDVAISIFATPDPVHLLQTVTIQGAVTLPENASSPLPSVQVEIWWGNSTSNYLLGTAFTNSTGGFLFYYLVPIGQSAETVTVWAHYTSLLSNIADGESVHEPLTIEVTTTLITVNEDFHTYHLNESVLLYGHLEFSNGTPITLKRVFILWTNSSGTYEYQAFTNLTGDYQFQYNFSITMDPGIISVNVNWTSGTPFIADAFGTLVPNIQLVRYNVEIALSVPTQIYIDEDLIIQGILTFEGGVPPISGEWIYIANYNGTDWIVVGTAVTNSTGGFLVIPIEEYGSQFAVLYYSPGPLISNYTDYFDVIRVKYPMSLDISVSPNPVKLNGTVIIHVYLYYQNNGTPLSNAVVSIYWYNGTVIFLGNVTTDGTGQADLNYSGMDYDTVWSNIEVYGYYAGTSLRAEIESSHTLLTLEQWLTEVYNLNTDQPSYRLTETVIVTGNLRFILPSVPYANVTVELLLSGVPVNSTKTASDGSFTLYWKIPQDTPIGQYTLVVRFLSAYPWIADSQATVPQIDINAPGYLWMSFSVTPSSPTEVYILQNLQISGTVTWDNGTYYSNSEITLFWGLFSGDPLGGSFMKNVTTDAFGNFATSFQVPAGTSTGGRQVWAYIFPAGYATFGLSPTVDIIVARYSVIITVSVDTTTVHLGEQITFNGTAVFSNSTPLNDYPIEIYWGGFLSTVNITAGTFSYVYTVPYTLALGVRTGNVFFRAPTAAFVNITQNFPDVTVREYVSLYLNMPPPVTVFTRGGTVVVTGYVTDDRSQPASGVTVEVLVDGAGTGVTGVTASDGTFSISLGIPPNQPTGLYTLAIDSRGLYHDVLSSPTSWTVSVYRDSIIAATVTGGAFMPGEHLLVTVRLHDDQGTSIDGVTVHIFLNDTEIAAPFLTNGDGEQFSIIIPMSWADGSGVLIVRAEFSDDPLTFTYGDSSTAVDSVHIFTNVQFSLLSPARINPNQAFIIEFALSDPDGRPIEGRNVLLTLNHTNTVQLTTDSNGRISNSSRPYQEGTTLSITVTLTSPDTSDIVSGEFMITIQSQGDNSLQTDLLIAGILLVGTVIAVLAYLYIVKGMFRSTVISRGVDIPTKLRNIKKLADAGKYGASITLAYRTFEQMCGAKIGSERTHSETAREYLDRVLQSLPLDGATVEQFVQTYEEARFSHHEMTRERYESALRVFTDLYPRIDSGTPME
jgi:hypothetical protein